MMKVNTIGAHTHGLLTYLRPQVIVLFYITVFVYIFNIDEVIEIENPGSSLSVRSNPALFSADNTEVRNASLFCCNSTLNCESNSQLQLFLSRYLIAGSFQASQLSLQEIESFSIFTDVNTQLFFPKKQTLNITPGSVRCWGCFFPKITGKYGWCINKR